MLSRFLTAIPPNEQVWGETESMAVVVLLIAAVVLTLALGGLFLYIIINKDQESD